jgi:hypothetical protein
MGTTDEGKQKNPLTAGEICSIIKACAEARVATLKFGDLCVEFGATPALNQEIRVETTLPAIPTLATAPPATPAAEMAAVHATIEKEQLTQDEFNTRREQLDQMLIENPLLAEELMQKWGIEINGEESPE